MPLSYDWSGLTLALADLKALVRFSLPSRVAEVESAVATQSTRLDTTDGKVTTLESAQQVSSEESVQRYSEFVSFKGAVDTRFTSSEASTDLLAGRVATLESADPTQVLSRLSALELEDVDVKARLTTAESAKTSAESRLVALEGEDVDVKARIDALESATAISARLEALEMAVNTLSEQLASYAPPPEQPPA